MARRRVAPAAADEEASYSERQGVGFSRLCTRDSAIVLPALFTMVAPIGRHRFSSVFDALRHPCSRPRRSTTSSRAFTVACACRSHIGASPIQLPESVECKLQGNTPEELLVAGPLGHKRLVLPEGIAAHFTQRPSASASASTSASLPSSSKSNTLNFTCDDVASRIKRSTWGLTRTQAENAVVGLSEGFKLDVKLVGVGYRATLENASSSHQQSDARASQTTLAPTLVLRLGYPRPIRLQLPPGIECDITSPTELILRGSDKQVLGHFAAIIRGWRKPEPYNGKGIFVGGEQVRRKEVRKK